MFSTVGKVKNSKNVFELFTRFATTNSGKAPWLKLSDGNEMPVLGLGSWNSPIGKAGNAVTVAVRGGYRKLDCANDYGNEREIGAALKKLYSDGVVKREDLFIQAKLWNSNHRKDHVKADLVATLEDLGTDYLDSFVIHWAQACPATGTEALINGDGLNYPDHYSKKTLFPLDDDNYYKSDNECRYFETWDGMENVKDEKLVKSIGLSNFNRKQVEEILHYAKKYPPVVLQNERHPYLQCKDLLDFCNIHGIQFESYSPLGSAGRPYKVSGSITSGLPKTGTELLDDPHLNTIAKKYDKTPAQVVLRWHIQVGSSVVPKSVTKSRILENIDVFDFELSDEDIKSFDRLNVGWRHLLWAETAMHPDYPYKEDLPFDYVVQRPGKGSTAPKTKQ